MKTLVAALALASCLALAVPARAQDDKPEPPKPEKKDDKKEKPLDDAAVKELLAKRKVTLNLDATPLGEALGLIADLSGLNLVADPALAEKKVSLKAKDLTLEAVLKLVCAQADLQSEVWRGLVYFQPKKAFKKPAPAPKLPDDVAKALDEKRLPFVFDAAPVAEALALLKDMTGVPVAIDEAVAKTLKVTLSLKDASARTILEVLCRQHGLKLEAADKGVKLVKR